MTHQQCLKVTEAARGQLLSGAHCTAQTPTCTRTQTSVHICTHTYKHAYTHAHAHRHAPANIWDAQSGVHAGPMQTRLRLANENTHSMHPPPPPPIHTHARAHTHTYTHTHTHTRTSPKLVTLSGGPSYVSFTCMRLKRTCLKRYTCTQHSTAQHINRTDAARMTYERRHCFSPEFM